MKLGIKIGIALVVIGLVIFGLVSWINVNDTANTKLQEIDGYKSKVEVSLDKMNKTIKQLVETTGAEADVFLKFQALVADSKKGQTLGGIMSQIQEKYPDFDVKGFDKVMTNIEAQRDEFAIAQNSYNDRVVQYNSYIVKKMNSVLLGNEHVKLEQFVVSSGDAKESMITGKDETEKLTF